MADEPVSALDVSIRFQVLIRMKSLQAGLGLTYIVISHDLAVVRYLADQIGVVIGGELPSALNQPSGCRFRTRCPGAQDLCAAEEPPLRPYGSGHLAACHFRCSLPWPPTRRRPPLRRPDARRARDAPACP